MFDDLDFLAASAIAGIACVIFVALMLPLSKRRRDGFIKLPMSDDEIALSSLPSWDEEWEQHDPLRGKAGWELRDYVNIVVAFCLMVTAIGLVVPLISMAREAESRIMNQQKHMDLQIRQHVQIPE